MDDSLIRDKIKFTCESNNVITLFNQIEYKFVPYIDNRVAQCFPNSNLIEISQSHWDNSSFAEKTNTIVHETAHLIVGSMHGLLIEPHGKEWRLCMENAGEVPFISSKEYKEGGELLELTCGCCSVKVTKSRATQITKKLMYCEKCNEPVCLSIGDIKIV